MAKTKAELLDEARDAGAEADESMTNDEIQAAIDDATDGAGASSGDASGLQGGPGEWHQADVQHSDEQRDAADAGGRSRGELNSTSGTTRDATDQGVPMVPGHPDEPVGPEDALGAGPKRGDYSDRQDGSQHFESVPNPNAGAPIRDDDGNVVDFEPAYGLRPQNPRVADVGDVPGEKGGVTTG